VPRTASEKSKRASRASATRFFQTTLQQYRDLTNQRLLAEIPAGGPPYLYDLVSSYPLRAGKGLRSALCLATCAALGGDVRKALNTAVAIELLHNGFLIHDDVQDESENRRGAPTLHREHGIPIAINVGNATHLLALQRLMENRRLLGNQVSWRVMRETERMMACSLAGQALELGWIRDNACALTDRDYLQMCLRKTSWYSFIYPMRVGALIATGRDIGPGDFCSLGWYVGAAFQIQDDLLNLCGDYGAYGKEIGGDLLEGKRTLILIHLLKHCSPRERRRLTAFLALPRNERSNDDVAWIFDRIKLYGSLDHVRRIARQLVGAALLEGVRAFRDVPDSSDKRFILEMILYVAERDR
jgi:geranylgeranyl diphosphate synthase, type II